METCKAPAVSRPAIMPPAFSCDTHSHVFAPLSQFRLHHPPHYALPTADSLAHAAARKAMGIERGVLTQPAAYGADPGAMLAAIEEAGGALCGIAVAGVQTDRAKLEDWQSRGIVGLRFTEYASGRPRFAGSVGFDAIGTLAPVMRALGLHAQLWAPLDILVARMPELLAYNVPLVIDHMGMPDVSAGPGADAFRALCRCLEHPDVWIKLSICRVGPGASDYDAVRPFHQALIERAADWCLWGSDWPYVAMPEAPDAGMLLSLFMRWVNDPALCRRILSDNPARLYGFDGDVR
ncbi:putative TIM-barrel fold metal-dependent hydrolase [Novosphingobium sp. SG751A]|uniref:amidohydrolase family protein n=1 Tax=Novosphingobium sp. SG751A TaxID=2587000 RepID=UPI0015531C13|nr:amidohydrolase family protein [Novosphingobium sp. SG751A]NOW48061.1 putative TIM-barrel fold metal-dependent hydrolase [Novosphingobium sp. SG751A]